MAKMIGVLADKPHIAHVAVLVKEQRVDGESVDRMVEIPVRKEVWDSLKTAKQQEAYAQECAEYHSAQGPGWQQKRAARRKIWDDDDKAKADAEAVKVKADEEARLAGLKAEQEAAQAAARAQAEAARQAELAKFVVVPQGFIRGKNGEVIGVQATITHQGYTCTANIGLVPSLAEENARRAWQASKDAADQMQAALDQFAVGK